MSNMFYHDKAGLNVALECGTAAHLVPHKIVHLKGESNAIFPFLTRLFVELDCG
jgi:hypothetical protein